MVRAVGCSCDEEAGSWLAGDVNGVNERDGGCTVDGERKEASVMFKERFEGLQQTCRRVLRWHVLRDVVNNE